MQSGAPGQSSVPCATCGRPIDPRTAVYSKAGALVCTPCNSAIAVHESSVAASKSAFYAALGALVTGIISIPCNLFFLLSFGAILGGVVSIRLLIRPEFRTSLGTLYPWTWAASIGAILTGLVQPMLWLMVIVVTTISRAWH